MSRKTPLLTLRHLKILVLGISALAAVSCGRGDAAAEDPYADLARQEKIERIESDRKLSDFEKYSKLAELEKEAKSR